MLASPGLMGSNKQGPGCYHYCMAAHAPFAPSLCTYVPVHWTPSHEPGWAACHVPCAARCSCLQRMLKAGAPTGRSTR